MNELFKSILKLSDTEWKELSEQRRFWLKVDIKNEEDCWKWLGLVEKNVGYGISYYRGKTNRAHRTAYILTNEKPLSRNQIIRHKCDNKICCNPNHLELGSHFDNVRDWQTRKINQVGENNFAAKLTENQVEKIRRRHADGEMQKTLAAEFNVSTGSICQIIHGWTWKHTFIGEIKRRTHSLLTKSQMKSIKQEYDPMNMSQSALARKYSVSRSSIRRILEGDYKL